MLVAISGSQGSGKSTIIKRLQDDGYNVITRKTSRSILADWGTTLSEVNNDRDLSVQFQEEITKRKFQDEEEAIHSNELWFTERTHADLFAYTLVALGKDNEYSDWLNGYYHRCMEYNQYYNMVYYLRAGMFNVEHDGVRGSNHHYSRMVDTVMLDVTQQMIRPNSLNVIDTPDLEQRVNMITVQSEYVHRSLNK